MVLIQCDTSLVPVCRSSELKTRFTRCVWALLHVVVVKTSPQLCPYLVKCVFSGTSMKACLSKYGES